MEHQSSKRGRGTSNPKAMCAGSPASSCVSMKSDDSMDNPPVFSSGPASFIQKAMRAEPASPAPSYVSMKSDDSMDNPPVFSSGPVSFIQNKKVVMEHQSSKRGRGTSNPKAMCAGSPASSCVSMKSDDSMDNPPVFSSGPASFIQKAMRAEPASPAPSYVSMKSDDSMDNPPVFSSGPVSFIQKAMRAEPASPAPSYVSMKSDDSMDNPPVFSSGPASFIQKAMRAEPASPAPSYVSMKSDDSMDNPPVFSSGPVPFTQKQHSTETALQIKTIAVETGHLQQNSFQTVDDVLHRVLARHKTSMKNKYETLFEGVKTQENKTLLNRVYTQLYIIEGESEGVNEEHEVLQMGKTPKKHLQDIPINCSEIFKPLHGPERETNISAVMAKNLSLNEEDNGQTVEKLRTVLTKGIAGIGKTVSVQKFILDWAEGKANQDVDFMFVLPFRELNLIKDDQYSLHGLLCSFHPELKDLDPKIYDQIKAVFIFDGLDESRIPLNFEQCEKISDITMTSSVCVLMANLIKGELLPSARIWITSRPAAANQIPPKYINRVTEIQGFNDPQKEEYFRKKISDEDQAKRIISHIKTVRSLHIMCHIPVFCWISATVLQQIMKQRHTEIPKTLTEMYSHFLITQTNMKNEKYKEKHEGDPKKLLESNRIKILKLAELAFKQLMKGNVMFYEEDLRESSIDVTEASVYSGIFTEIFRKEECVLFQKKVYCFVHLSFQEFLAAVYVFHCYESEIMEPLQFFLHDNQHNHRSQSKTHKHRSLSENVPLDELLKEAVDKSLKSLNGHLDLFLRFLLGISLKSNQRLLRGLLTHTYSCSKKTTQYIKKQIKRNEDKQYQISTDRSINLFLCLSEMNDKSLSKEVREYLKSEKHSEKKISPGQCSALACMLLISDEVMDELDLKKYNTSEEGYRRLIPALTVCRKALLAGCDLTTNSCETLCSALQSANSSLKELDLSNNDLQDSGVVLLCAGLKSLHCKLEILRLSGCMVTDEGCSSLALALKSNPSHLRELDLTYNDPGESGVKLLSDLLEDPHCALDTLRVEHGGKIRINPGLKKFACELTLDPNTINSKLTLSEANRKVECVNTSKKQPYLDHAETFDYYNQVLSVESLTGRCYWEAEWSGIRAGIAISYRGINRKGDSEDCMFGYTNQSWSLYCNNDGYSVWHNYKRIGVPVPRSRSRSRRVGVYLDWVAGTLSFYTISPDTHTLTHLHTFNTTFTEPLYAGFWVCDHSSVHLCVT